MHKMKIVLFHTIITIILFILRTNTYTVGTILRLQLQKNIGRADCLHNKVIYQCIYSARCDKTGTLPNLLTGGSFYQNLTKYDRKWSKFVMK